MIACDSMYIGGHPTVASMLLHKKLSKCNYRKAKQLTLQISSPWNPPATSNLSFTARVLT